jgi:hypothetical protein
VDHASKPAQQIVCETLSQKYPTPKKMAGGVAQGVGPEFKLQYHKKKKKRPQRLTKTALQWRQRSLGERGRVEGTALRGRTPPVFPTLDQSHPTPCHLPIQSLSPLA